MSKEIWYIAGPMSGIPQFNFPAFDAATATLRAKGFTVVSPAELDDAAVRDEAMASPDGQQGRSVLLAGQTWADFLSRDVKLIADYVTGIILLPGWEQSKGARLEAFVGLLCGHEFRLWVEGDEPPWPAAVRVNYWTVAQGVTQEWVG